MSLRAYLYLYLCTVCRTSHRIQSYLSLGPGRHLRQGLAVHLRVAVGVPVLGMLWGMGAVAVTYIIYPSSNCLAFMPYLATALLVASHKICTGLIILPDSLRVDQGLAVRSRCLCCFPV